MNTEENNKLIAEFMGIKISQGDWFSENTWCSHEEEHLIEFQGRLTPAPLQYHHSWDWLMPVVEKIENMGFIVHTRSYFIDHIKIEIEYCIEFSRWDEECSNYIKISHLLQYDKSKIEATYKAVVEFIKWWCVENRIACGLANYPLLEAKYSSINEYYETLG